MNLPTLIHNVHQSDEKRFDNIFDSFLKSDDKFEGGSMDGGINIMESFRTMNKATMDTLKSIYNKKVYFTIMIIIILTFAFALALFYNGGYAAVGFSTNISVMFWSENLSKVVDFLHNTTKIAKPLLHDYLKKVMLGSQVGMEMFRSFSVIAVKYAKEVARLSELVTNFSMASLKKIWDIVLRISSVLTITGTLYSAYKIAVNSSSIFSAFSSMPFNMNLDSVYQEGMEEDKVEEQDKNFYTDDKMKFTGQTTKVGDQMFELYADEKEVLYYKPKKTTGIPTKKNDLEEKKPKKEKDEKKKGGSMDEHEGKKQKDKKEETDMMYMDEGGASKEIGGMSVETLADIIQAGMGLLDQDLEGGEKDDSKSDTESGTDDSESESDSGSSGEEDSDDDEYPYKM